MLVEFADIRILVLGVCEVPSSSVYINSNAGALLRPHDTEVGQAILTMTQGKLGITMINVGMRGLTGHAR